MALTEKQTEILHYIEKQVRETGYPPTIREIGRRFGFSSTGSVRDHLKALAGKKYLVRMPAVSRGIRLLKQSAFPTIPIVGRVAAGKPDLAVEEIEGEIRVDEKMRRDEKTFALRVKGDSMTGAGIRPGDYVVVKPQQTCEPGDIVVALIEDEATVKRFVRSGKTWLLEPANPAYEPIRFDEKTAIIGKVVGLIRYYD